VLYSAATFVILLFVSIGLLQVLAKNLERDEVTALAREVAELGSLLRNPDANRPLILMEIDPAQAVRAVASATIIYSRVRDASGNVLFETTGMQDRLPSDAFPQSSAAPVQRGAVRWIAADGRPYLLVSALGPLTEGGGSSVIQVAMDVSSDDELMSDYLRNMLVFLLLGIALSTAVSILVARHGTRPLHEIAAVVSRISADQLQERVEPTRWPRELTELAKAFDQMLERLEASFHQLKWFSADLAHELRTPVNVLMGEAEVALSKSRSEEEYRQVLESSLEEYQRLARLIDNLLFLARAENAQAGLKRVSFEVRKELTAISSYYEAAAQEQGTTVRVEGDVTLQADPTLVRRAVSNLFSNSLRHTSRGGEIVLAVVQNVGCVDITVTDTGSGISPEEAQRVFDRFYRGHNGARQHVGSGIGLAIVDSIMKLHGGTATLRSELGKGTCVRLRFPDTQHTHSVD